MANPCKTLVLASLSEKLLFQFANPWTEDVESKTTFNKFAQILAMETWSDRLVGQL